VRIGHARVSTQDQRLDVQHEGLTRSGCEKTFDDTMSGKVSDRPGLRKALEQLRRGLHSFTNDRRQCPAATIARVMESAMPWWNATRMPGFFGLRFTAWKSRKPTDTCATAR